MTNPFTYGLTTSQFQAQGTGPALKALLKAIAKWLETPEGGSLHLQDYDSDKDGYLDGVEIIYKTDRTWDGDPEAPESIWWNYTSLSGLAPNPDAPAANYTVAGIFAIVAFILFAVTLALLVQDWNFLKVA